jgi:hypothetical protein
MQTFTAEKYPGKLRWEKISEEVTNKTPKECYERFKEICAKVKANQTD